MRLPGRQSEEVTAARGSAAMLALLVSLLVAHDAVAAPVKDVAAIVGIVPAEDARKAIVVAASGEVYAGDGKGAWKRQLDCTTASTLTAAGRAGAAAVASGNGVVYRLADNGWSAIRLVQRGKAVLGVGPRAIAAVGRQLFALDSLTRGEPTKLGTAPGNVVAIAAGLKDIVVATDAGVFRAGAKPQPIKGVPRRPRLVSDRWALVDAAAFDLTTGKRTALPAGLRIGPATATADGTLVAVAIAKGKLELLTIRGATVTRDPIPATGTPVAVALDRANRALVAFAEGRLALRAPDWTVVELAASSAPEQPGAPPATQQ